MVRGECQPRGGSQLTPPCSCVAGCAPTPTRDRMRGRFPRSIGVSGKMSGADTRVDSARTLAHDDSHRGELPQYPPWEARHLPDETGKPRSTPRRLAALPRRLPARPSSEPPRAWKKPRVRAGAGLTYLAPARFLL